MIDAFLFFCSQDAVEIFPFHSTSKNCKLKPIVFSFADGSLVPFFDIAHQIHKMANVTAAGGFGKLGQKSIAHHIKPLKPISKADEVSRMMWQTELHFASSHVT